MCALQTFRVATVLLAAAVAASIATAGSAQTLTRPPRIAPIRPIATPRPFATVAPEATPVPGELPGLPRLGDSLMRPYVGHVPALPPQTSANTIVLRPGESFVHRTAGGPGGVHTMSVSGSLAVAPSVSGSCASSVGTIYNVNCQITWQLVNEDPNHRTYTHQDYFLDSSGANVDAWQTIGGTYTSVGCSTAISYSGYCGPTHTQTLNDAGTYVLASAVCNYGDCVNYGINYWEAVVYVVVGSYQSIQTYDDAAHTIEATNFFIPATGTTSVYIGATGLSATDTYVAYMEFTSYLPQCVYLAPFGAATAAQQNQQLCDPNSVTGFNAPSGTLSLVWPVDNTYNPGTYSVVVFDQTTQKRLGQRQVALDPLASSGNALVGMTPIAGPDASPAPVAQTTPAPLVSPAPPMQRYAYDNPTEASDSGITLNVTGLNGGGHYVYALYDPNGFTAASNTKFFYATGAGTWTYALAFNTTTEPQNFGPNTYTINLVQFGTSSNVGAGGFQIVGYNALTQFTNAAGSATVGTALTLPKGSSAGGGLEFLNDGDAVFGASNGDALREFFFTTNNSGITIGLPCGTTCSEVVSDSAGNQWNVTDTTTSAGTNSNSDIIATPVATTGFVANGQSLTLANLTFYNTTGNSGCTSGCQGYTQILPVDGRAWSNFNSSAASNPVYFTNSASNTYAGTAAIAHLGTVPTGTGYGGAGTQAGYEAHGYAPNSNRAIYALNEPFNAPTGVSDVYAVTATNASVQGGGGSSVAITGLQVMLPATYVPSGSGAKITVDPNSPAKWVKVTSGASVPANCAQANVICLEPTGGNSGIAGGGASQTIYLDVAGLPPTSFGYTDIGVSAFLNASFTLAPSSTSVQIPVGSANPYTVDSLALAAYSLDGALINPQIVPQSEGTNTNNAVSLTVQNTLQSADPFPDYVDAVVIDDAGGALNGISTVTPTGWSLLAQQPDGTGGTLYWFGLCPGNANWGDGPALGGQPPVDPSLPACSTATDEYVALAPGAKFSVSAQANTASVGGGGGTLNFTAWVHGANGNGWSNAHRFTMNVTPVSASAGFSAANGYPTAQSVPTNTEPQVGADSSTTYGNAYVYQIANTSGAGNPINSATITIPWQTTTGTDGADSSGTYFTLTGTPTLGGSGWTNCAITGTQNASSGTNGYITIGNSASGTCTLNPGGSFAVKFSMLAPYAINNEYAFSTVVNGGVNAGEAWHGDTYLKIVLTANLVVSVWPTGTGPGGGNPAPSCTMTCTYNQALGQVNLGSIFTGQQNSGSDVVMVSIYTDAANPYGAWSLYETVDANPANTGSPSNELLSSVDSAHSTAGGGLAFDQTVYGVIPTSGSGTQLVNTAASNAARRIPFDVVTNYQVNINGGPLTAQTHTVTFTFIPN